MTTEYARMRAVADALAAPLDRLAFDRRHLRTRVNTEVCADVIGDIAEAWLTVRDALVAHPGSIDALTAGAMRQHMSAARFVALKQVADDITGKRRSPTC